MNRITLFYYKFQLYSWYKGLKNDFSLPIDENKPKCFVFLAADYGNLGDVAITYTQELLLAKLYPEYQIVDVPISCTLSALPFIKKHIKDSDVVTITGGGNMSDLYFDIELFRLLIVKKFPNNKIIIFPQSIILSDRQETKSLLKIMSSIYPAHKNLLILAREKVSFNKMRELWPTVNVQLSPDVVMSYSPLLTKKERHGITFCLRKDKERIELKDLEQLPFVLRKSYVVEFYDTHINKAKLSVNEREVELNKIWKQFESSEWIITDRLHGMIFAFITRTPAMVIPNNNHKIGSCYEWIRNCGYIFFVPEPSINIILDILKRKDIQYNFEQVSNDIIDYFKKLL